MEKKMSTSVNTLCKNYPNEFAKILEYVRNLCFDEKPDYDFIRKLLKSLFLKNGFILDYHFDWNDFNYKRKKRIENEEI